MNGPFSLFFIFFQRDGEICRWGIEKGRNMRGRGQEERDGESMCMCVSLGTYCLMLLPIGIGQLHTFLAHIFFHCWIHGQFLAHGVTGKRPSKLITPLDLVFETAGGFDIGGILVDCLMVVANRL